MYFCANDHYMPVQLKSTTVYKGKLNIEQASITNHGKEFKRERINREDASAVLMLNTDSNKIILTRQFRYPINEKVNEPILEILAGKVDEGEQPLQTAIREAEEETGYRIKNDHIQLLMSCFSTPGYSSECFYIYYATVTHSDKIAKGGGLEEENENIEVIEMEVDEFIELVKNAEIKDAKTYIAGLYFANYI